MPVLGGYLGATRRRRHYHARAAAARTTLRRSWARRSGATAIEIWTDVDGMLDGGPRVVEGAHLIEHIRFDEAAGVRMFWREGPAPETIAPAVRLGIPVFVLQLPEARREGYADYLRCAAPPVRAIAGKSTMRGLKVRSRRVCSRPPVSAPGV